MTDMKPSEDIQEFDQKVNGARESRSKATPVEKASNEEDADEEDASSPGPSTTRKVSYLNRGSTSPS